MTGFQKSGGRFLAGERRLLIQATRSPSERGMTVSGASFRRFSPFCGPAGDGLLSEPTAGVQPCWREPRVMPHYGHWLEPAAGSKQGGYLSIAETPRRQLRSVTFSLIKQKMTITAPTPPTATAICPTVRTAAAGSFDFGATVNIPTAVGPLPPAFTRGTYSLLALSVTLRFASAASPI